MIEQLSVEKDLIQKFRNEMEDVVTDPEDLDESDFAIYKVFAAGGRVDLAQLLERASDSTGVFKEGQKQFAQHILDRLTERSG